MNRSRAERFGAAVVGGLYIVSCLAVGLAMPVHAAIATCSVQYGLYESSTPWDSSMTAIRNLDSAVNRHSAIVHWYAPWGDTGSGTFSLHQPALLDSVRNYSSVGVSGSTPMITWEPWGPPYSAANNQFPLAQIAAGNFDSYIDSWAGGLRAFGNPVFLDFAHEMDGNWFPWGYGVNGNTQDEYIAAFRHVHDRFAAAGATNVQFVWNVNVWNPAGVDQRTFYPGDSYVDYMAIDIFNWGANGGGWVSLSSGLSVYTNVYANLAGLSSRPMMLAEWASVEPVPADPTGVTKAGWIRSAAQALANEFPRITAVVWFNASGTSLALDSSSSSLSGARAAFGGC